MSGGAGCPATRLRSHRRRLPATEHGIDRCLPICPAGSRGVTDAGGAGRGGRGLRSRSRVTAAASVAVVAVAFVLSGGASLGAVEVGMLCALEERGIRPDVIVGTSVGAVNGAWLAGHPETPVSELADVWRGLHRADVFPTDARRGLLALAGRRRSFFDEHPLRALIERYL